MQVSESCQDQDRREWELKYKKIRFEEERCFVTIQW